MKITPWAIALICIYSAVKSSQLYFSERKAKLQVIQNWESASQGLEYFKTRSGREAVKVNTLYMQLYELRGIMPEIREAITDLRLKERQVTRFSETRTNTTQDIVTILKTQTVYDTVLIKKFDYSDAWTDFAGTIKDDTLTAHISINDTVFFIDGKGERARPWLWIFSKRKNKSYATNRNPHSKIMYYNVIKKTGK